VGRISQGDREDEDQVKKVLILGLGSIGKRHAGILLKYFECEVYAFRSGRRSGPCDPRIREVFAWSDVERLRPDIAFITNPTSLHIDTAIRCAELGMHLFIEKPLSHNLAGIDRLESICRRNRLTCYTAYCLRFHPVIKKMRFLARGKKIYHARVVCSSYLPDWRPGQDYRKGYSVFRAKGGGALLDLSHEFDYIQYILGIIKKIEGITGRASALTRDACDFADALLTMGSGAHVNIHVNFFSRINERSVRIDFDGGSIRGDLLKGRVDFLFRGKRRVFIFDVDRDRYIREEICYFFDNIGNKAIMNSLGESKRFLKKILELKNE
jgi:predicted dehydrogenase